MPCFRGIEASIGTQSDVGRLPEYPHPDDSSYQLCDTNGASQDGQPSPHADDHQVAVDKEPTRLPISNPMMSVYVPSLPGAQFWLNYVVERDAFPDGHLFFKLYMNGRHITSWGINPRIKSNGRVEKALYEPSNRWDQEENGVMFKQEGIEARYFYFVSDQQELSIANDGGLIEVLVFRAKGRKRRAANLDRYRQQDKYGITTPSGGLLDNPQDITFYDFHLIDPKDTPFATFRFHYRSWSNLELLNFIPTDEPSILDISIVSPACGGAESLLAVKDEAIESDTRGTTQSFSARPDPDELVFNDSISSGNFDTSASSKTKPKRNASFVLRTPPQLRPQSTTSQNLPQPSKTLRDALPPGFPETYLQRPLPDRPLPELPTDRPNNAWASRSRKLSTASTAPSIAPSLLSYVKNDSYLDETVEYGQALAVPMDKDHPGVPLNQESSGKGEALNMPMSDTSILDYEKSVLTQTDEYKENDPKIQSPDKNLASTESMLEKQLNRCGSGQGSPGQGINHIQGSKRPQTKAASSTSGETDTGFFKRSDLELARSQWIRRTPSPQAIPRRILSPRLGRLWNTLRRNKSRSPMRNLREGAVLRNFSTPHLTGSEVKERRGNWI